MNWVEFTRDLASRFETERYYPGMDGKHDRYILDNVSFPTEEADELRQQLQTLADYIERIEPYSKMK